VHPTLNDHEYYMRPVCVIHAVWRHFILVPSTSFSQVLWSVLWLCYQFVTDVTAWLINPSLSCSKNRKLKEKKMKNKIQGKEKIKTESTVNDLDIRSLKVDLILLYYSFHFHFHFNSFSIFLFLELRVRVRGDKNTLSHISHIRWHSNSNSYKLHDAWKDIEGSRKMRSYNVWHTCWP